MAKTNWRVLFLVFTYLGYAAQTLACPICVEVNNNDPYENHVPIPGDDCLFPPQSSWNGSTGLWTISFRVCNTPGEQVMASFYPLPTFYDVFHSPIPSSTQGPGWSSCQWQQCWQGCNTMCNFTECLAQNPLITPGNGWTVTQSEDGCYSIYSLSLTVNQLKQLRDYNNNLVVMTSSTENEMVLVGKIFLYLLTPGGHNPSDGVDRLLLNQYTFTMYLDMNVNVSSVQSSVHVQTRSTFNDALDEIDTTVMFTMVGAVQDTQYVPPQTCYLVQDPSPTSVVTPLDVAGPSTGVQISTTNLNAVNGTYVLNCKVCSTSNSSNCQNDQLFYVPIQYSGDSSVTNAKYSATQTQFYSNSPTVPYDQVISNNVAVSSWGMITLLTKFLGVDGFSLSLSQMDICISSPQYPELCQFGTQTTVVYQNSTAICDEQGEKCTSYMVIYPQILPVGDWSSDILQSAVSFNLSNHISWQQSSYTFLITQKFHFSPIPTLNRFLNLMAVDSPPDQVMTATLTVQLGQNGEISSYEFQQTPQSEGASGTDGNTWKWVSVSVVSVAGVALVALAVVGGVVYARHHRPGYKRVP